MIDRDDYVARYAADYDAMSFEKTIVAVRRRRVLSTVGYYPHAHLLEVGCGLEPLFGHIDDFSTFTVVEPSTQFAARATELAGSDTRIRIVNTTLEESRASRTECPFDMVVVSSLLHEVPDPDRLLASIRAVCGRETVVHINVPNVRSFHRLLALEMGLVDDVFDASETERRFGRQTRYDLDTLTRTVQRAGFEVIRSGTYFVKPFTHDQMANVLAARILPDGVIEGLDRMVRHLPGMGAEAFVELRPAP